MKAKLICPHCGLERVVVLEDHLAEMERLIKKQVKSGGMSKGAAARIRVHNDINRLRKLAKEGGRMTALCEDCTRQLRDSIRARERNCSAS